MWSIIILGVNCAMLVLNTIWSNKLTDKANRLKVAYEELSLNKEVNNPLGKGEGA